MEDFELCHITSVCALNGSKLISFMLAISEDMMDADRGGGELGQRTKCARNLRK